MTTEIWLLVCAMLLVLLALSEIRTLLLQRQVKDLVKSVSLENRNLLDRLMSGDLPTYYAVTNRTRESGAVGESLKQEYVSQLPSEELARIQGRVGYGEQLLDDYGDDDPIGDLFTPADR